MENSKDKKISQNMTYFIKEIELDGKKLYAIMETLKGKGGSTNDYDLRLYFSNLKDAEDKLKMM